MRLDGKPVAQFIETVCKHHHNEYQARYASSVNLGVISIGEDPASQVYISHKKKVAKRLGFGFYEKNFPASTPPESILETIAQWGQDMSGIIIQLPLPSEHNPITYLAAVPPEKDVDGLHPYYTSHQIPCTPLGCLFLLTYYHIPLQGAHCVVVGRSRLVGQPLARLLMTCNATVTTTHSHTRDLPSLTRQADILFVCAGQKHLIKPCHVSPHTIVIDIGIHRTKTGITGDVCPEVYSYVKAVSPVPRGVGPLTVITLMWNTLCAAFQAKGTPLILKDLLEALKINSYKQEQDSIAIPSLEKIVGLKINSHKQEQGSIAVPSLEKTVLR